MTPTGIIFIMSYTNAFSILKTVATIPYDLYDLFEEHIISSSARLSFECLSIKRGSR